MIPSSSTWSCPPSSPTAASRVNLNILGAAHVTMLRRVAFSKWTTRSSSAGRSRALRSRGEGRARARRSRRRALWSRACSRESSATSAKRLHTARSRNDQDAARSPPPRPRSAGGEDARESRRSSASSRDRAAEGTIIIPWRTMHRQRAMPVGAAFLIAAWSMQFLRGSALDLAGEVRERVAARRGRFRARSLPIDRRASSESLGFESITEPRSTVGDRDSRSTGRGPARACSFAPRVWRRT